MAVNRTTTRQRSDATNRRRREEMQVAIAEGRLTVRQMTAKERKESDAHRAAHAEVRAARAASRSAKRVYAAGAYLPAPLATRERVAAVGRNNDG